jgi:hypothetical protein
MLDAGVVIQGEKSAFGLNTWLRHSPMKPLNSQQPQIPEPMPTPIHPSSLPDRAKPHASQTVSVLHVRHPSKKRPRIFR